MDKKDLHFFLENTDIHFLFNCHLCSAFLHQIPIVIKKTVFINTHASSCHLSFGGLVRCPDTLSLSLHYREYIHESRIFRSNK